MCRSCGKWGKNLESHNDKFSCVCNASLITTLTIYDTIKDRIICEDICQNRKLFNNQVFIDQLCQNNELVQHNSNCKYKYINRTTSTSESSLRMIEIAYKNWRHDNDCIHCDLHYNFNYQSYCIAKILLRSYLNYDSFWQVTTQNSNELKFVAFFCITLRNNTACNHLANLCVMAFYAVGKNSPCNRFLLTQASETLYRYSSMDEQLLGREIKPFLYYRKGKEMHQMLRNPIEGLTYNFNSKEKNNHRLNIFQNIYDLNGNLLLWDSMKLSSVNLCSRLNDPKFISFNLATEKINCFLTLENLIDISSLYSRNKYISWFLNYTTKTEPNKVLMQTLPIFIEDLNKEVEPFHGGDWLLVKRFQLIYFHTHQNIKNDLPPTYENSYKLSNHRFGRYVEKVEFQIGIYERNQIGVPLIKLKYRYLDFSQNLSLDSQLPFEFIISFKRQGEQSINEILNELCFPILLVLTIVLALLRMWWLLKQRHGISSSASSPLSSVNNEEFCTVTLVEFLLLLIDYTSSGLLIYFLLHIHMNSLIYYNQNYTQVTLPLLEDYHYLKFVICSGAVLKLISTFTKFWHLSHFNVFFIDWERPRYGDTNNVNLTCNMGTTSSNSNAGQCTNKGNVSAWRSIFLINEWLRLSSCQRTSTILQSFATYVAFNIFATDAITYNDNTLKLFVFTLSSMIVYCLQYILRNTLIKHLFGNPMQIFTNHCSLANISIFVLIESSYGYYIHGRSPNGFTDADVSTIISQFQRGTQTLNERRGLLNDADQCYIITPPKNLYNYFNKLLLRLQRSIDSANVTIGGDNNSIFQTHYHKGIDRGEGSLEKTSTAYNNINRFFCAFVDHGIKDMDYIVKEKTLLERLLSCELNQNIYENKGIFYEDKNYSFNRLFLYGHDFDLFILHFLILTAVYTMFANALAAVITVCVFNKIFLTFYHLMMRKNISTKTLLHERFLS